MRWLITGAGGMLGRHVLQQLATEGADGDSVIGLGRAELDITEAGSVRSAFAEHLPDIVVNCAAYTAVDDAEAHEPEALRANGEGPRQLAAACAEHRARLIHVSTDYVFSGNARAPYPEDHPPAPGTAYGRSKLAGERAVLAGPPGTAAVVRTAWLYGSNGRNFVRTMIDLESRRDTIDVVDDQWGQPTWAADAAELLVSLGRRPDAAGIFHATNSGEATWYDLARETFRLIGADPARVRRTTSEKFASPTPRPSYTVLGHGRWAGFGIDRPRNWRCALRAALETRFPR